MTTLELYATLTAAATDAPEPRVAEVQIVPYGVPGRTSAGLKRIQAGALRMVDGAPVIGLYGHRMPGAEPRGVSRLIAHDERPDGLYGRLRVAETPLGDELLAEIRGGVREGVSVELSDVQYHPADPDLVTSARLDAVAHVPLPAYDSARVSALAASLNDPTGDISVTDTATAAPVVEPAAPAAPALDYSQLAAALAPLLTAAAVPGGLPTGALSAAPHTALTTVTDRPAAPPAGGTLEALASLQAAQAVQGGSDSELRAALADITNSDLPLFQRPAGAIPQELWRTIGYERRYVPLLTPRPLTSMNFGGWEFVDLPQVDDWAGDKTQIPTNEVTTREITGTAQRLAGGWDIDRKFRDFGDAQFWTAFYQAQTESYARKTDLKAVAAIVAAAQDVTGTAAVEGYTRPPGYGTVATQADVLKAVAFGTAYLEDTPLIYDHPDYVIMNTADWLGLLDITNLDLPAFLTLLGVEPGQFLRSPFVPSGQVILGINEALQWYELPGAAPIRVEALDVARGGIDDAVFGYWGTLHTRPGGIISVPLTSAG